MTDFGRLQTSAQMITLTNAWDEAAKAGAAAQTAWLHSALRTAIQLEFSTIPPYLTALWSIKDASSPVALAIRGVVQEEMLHMALACNMLVAVGGTPPLADKDFAPRYPGPLPGGVHPGLIVGLSGLTKDVVEAFMVIERPEADLSDETAELVAASRPRQADKNTTGIGAFYDTILAAFRTLDPDLSTERQISGPLSWYAVRSLDEVAAAITLIQHQGEGSPLDAGEGLDKVTGNHELAHFYRFLEIHSGRAIGRMNGKEWGFTGETVAWPEVWPVAEVPEGGHDAATVAPAVAALLTAFDRQYATLLRQLNDLWATGDQGLLVEAIRTMFTLQDPALALMKTPIPGDAKGRTYGPNFRVPGDMP